MPIAMRPLLVLLALPVAMTVTPAGGTAVNRCVVDGAVLYTDQPCPRATVVAIDAGAAAPDAAERLRRDQQALDQRAAARRDALARDAAMARMDVVRVPEGTPPPSNEDNAVYDFAWSPWPLQANGVRDRRDRARPHDEERGRDHRRARVITQPPPTPLRAGR